MTGERGSANILRSRLGLEKNTSAVISSSTMGIND